MKSLADLKASSYQLVPLTKLLSNGQNALLICDGVGVGKTISAGYILTYLTGVCRRAGLVVCPPGLQEKWHLELRDKFHLKTNPIRTKEELHFAIDHWDSEGEFPLVNIMPSSLLQANRAFNFRGPIIFDEIHNYRNRETKLWRSAKLLSLHASHRVGLSATPINNGVADLGSELSILLNLNADVTDALVSELWRPERQAVIYVLMTRFSKEKLGIHFAHRNAHDIKIEFSGDYLARVVAGIKTLRSRPQNEKMFRDEITYFRLGASSPRAFMQSTSLIVPEAMEKKEALSEILRRHGATTIIIFCEFEATAHDIENYVDDRPAFVVTGSVPVYERDAILAQFRDTANGVLILTSVGAEGLDLQFCSTLVNFDLTWNPMILEQRIGRIDRIGQEKDEINIYNFIVDGSIDARIIKTLGRKLGLIEGSILEPRTVLSSIETPMFGDFEPTALESEFEKARSLVRAVELSNQIIPDDYELADAMRSELCDLQSLELLASGSAQIALSDRIASDVWRNKMLKLRTELAESIGHYCS